MKIGGRGGSRKRPPPPASSPPRPQGAAMAATDAPPAPFALFDNSPTFQMARQQLASVAEVIEIDPGVLDRMSFPKRALVVSIPVRMDDDQTEMFLGYRVQHSLTSGPSKGGLRYHPS